MNILFDLDGTLVDSSSGITSAFRYCFKKLGLEEPNDEQLRRFIGPPLETTFANYFQSKEDIESAILTFREYYNTKGVYQVSLYDGVKESLQELSQYGSRLFVTTSKNEPMARLMLKILKIDNFFTAIYGALPDRFSKADVIAACLENYQLESSDSFIVGDTSFDIIGGQENKIKTVAATWGFGNYDELNQAKPDFWIDKPQDIKQVRIQ
ncbi:HAD hydrolase-like protein [Streptococcus loxodontisalivarius]|uniref:Phosphoglycolate phosphatase n=1 Tax=Streptococcus loxodontisalivarius TaxID=1349415 RepID=A0ABS2PPF4_9STRE|nr:HAD hydrolase-like protein [Streptococcus loxodontisalivarius]MBM7641904.1 phosphoglycolate phosphatase [Streptococcus loxodontisalivarius]